MKITTLAPLLGLGLLVLAACEQLFGPGPTGTVQQPAASPSEAQQEEPQAREPGEDPIQ